MSQRSRPTRSSQRTINTSQNCSSSQVERLTQSQTLTKSAQDDLVQKCVRLFLVKLRSNIPIKRAQIVQQLCQERRIKNFDDIIKNASEILEEVYGLKLCTLDADTTSNKKYILTNNLEHSELMNNTADEEFKVTLRFLVLTHIFMSKDSATETSLWEFLKGLNILPQKEISGGKSNADTFITKQLVKEQYIRLETVGTANDDGETKKLLSWGTRAEECVSKMKILKFVAKLYGNVPVKSWSSRYEDAVKQSGDNSDDVEMVSDDGDGDESSDE